MARGIKEISSEKAPGVKGGQKGGQVAAANASSSAAIAKMLSGIDLPRNKNEILKFVNKKNKKNNLTQDSNKNKILEILNELPEKTYHKITDIEKEVGK